MRTIVLIPVLLTLVIIKTAAAYKIDLSGLKTALNSKSFKPENFALPPSFRKSPNSIGMADPGIFLNTLKDARKKMSENREEVIEKNLRAHLKGKNFIETMANMGAAMVIQAELDSLKEKAQKNESLNEIMDETNVAEKKTSRWNILCNAVVIGENKLGGNGDWIDACEKMRGE